MISSLDGPIVIVFPSLDNCEDPCAGAGELRAVSFLGSFLRLHFDSDDIHVVGSRELHARGEESYRDANLILLGGPIANPVTKHVLDALDYEPFKVIERSNAVDRSKQSVYELCGAENSYDTEYRGERRGPTEFKHDYGLGARRRNPFTELKRYVFLCLGCHTYGTHAAAAIMFAPQSGERIARHFEKSGEDITVIAKIENVEDMEKGREVKIRILEPPDLADVFIYNDASLSAALQAHVRWSDYERVHAQRMLWLKLAVALGVMLSWPFLTAFVHQFLAR